MVKRVLRWLAGGGVAERNLIVLTYHRVLEKPDNLLGPEVDQGTFRSQMKVLNRHFTPLPLKEAVDRMYAGDLPELPVVVTFDDGYRNNFDLALPVLLENNIPATFFVASGYLGNGLMWNDAIIEMVRQVRTCSIDLEKHGLGVHDVSGDAEKKTAIANIIAGIKYLPFERRKELVCRISEEVSCSLPEDMMMLPEHVAAIHAAGMDIGGHTVNHPILSAIDDGLARTEILEGRRMLEEIINEKIVTFAYPNGRPGQDYGIEHVRMLEEGGFSVAVTTSWGCVTPGAHRLQVPRVTTWDKSVYKYMIRVSRTYKDDVSSHL